MPRNIAATIALLARTSIPQALPGFGAYPDLVLISDSEPPAQRLIADDTVPVWYEEARYF